MIRMALKHILSLLFFLFSSVYVLHAQEQDSLCVSLSESDYFGADLTRFPPEARTWIMTIGFPPAKMTMPHMQNPQLKVSWAEDGHALQFEASYTVAPGYMGAGTVAVWGKKTRYRGESIIYQRYGEYAKFHTLRFKWELAQYSREQMANDTAYAQVAAVAQELCQELEYDWASLRSYKGAEVKRTPDKRYCACDGYADEAMDRFLQLECVQAVQKWSSGSHAWNVLKLKDGRVLYADMTWFDNEYLNHKTGCVEPRDDYDWKNLTFDEELFRYSNVSYTKRIFEHLNGRMVAEKTNAGSAE